MTDMGRVTILTEQGLQLQIQTIQFTPAVVSFNADQISTILDEQLVKYQGLTFTEDSEAEAKKVIAELRKGKALLETYRKTTKAELTAPVTAFEQQIKKLAEKFDAVILPLTEQTDRFETDRVAAKREDIQKAIDALIVKYSLSMEFWIPLKLEDHYLNRTTSMKTINAELLAKAIQLKADQDRKESEIKLIRGNVDLVNRTLEGAGLLESTYTRLLETRHFEDVLQQITEDAMSMKIREQQAAERRLNEEIRQAKIAEEAERRAVEAQVAQANREAAVKPLHPIAEISKHLAEEPVQVSGIYKTHIYTITGTQDEHQELQDFLSDRLYEWRASL